MIRLSLLAAMTLIVSLLLAAPSFADGSLSSDVLKKAAAGDANAESQVAGAYASVMNYDQARAWFARAAQHGAQYASASIGYIDNAGLGHHTGPEKAVLPPGGNFVQAPAGLDATTVASNLPAATALAAKSAAHPQLVGIAADSSDDGGSVVYSFVAGQQLISVTSTDGELAPAAQSAPVASNDNTTPLPAHFIDLATALDDAKTQGMTGALQSASLAVQQPKGKPARAIWQIVADDDSYYYVDGGNGAKLTQSDYSEDDFPALAAQTEAMRQKLAQQQSSSGSNCPKPPMFTIGINASAPFFEHAFCTSHPGCPYFAGTGEVHCP